MHKKQQNFASMRKFRLAVGLTSVTDVLLPGKIKEKLVGAIKLQNRGHGTLDKLDKLILNRLQANGRATYDQIAETVALSPSALLRRVKRLEKAGVIDRYVALVKPEAVSLGLMAHINVRLEKVTGSHKLHPRDWFRASVQTWVEVVEVVECDALSGEMDYSLRVLVKYMSAYSHFVMDTLLKHPSVQDCKTSFVLDRVKATTALPL